MKKLKSALSHAFDIAHDIWEMFQTTILSLILVVMIILLVVKLNPSKHHTLNKVVSDEVIVSLNIEQKEKIFMGPKNTNALIFINTTDRSYVFDEDDSHIEFIVSDEPSLTVREKVFSPIFKNVGNDYIETYVTIKMNDELLKQTTKKYTNEFKRNLNISHQSEYESFDKQKSVD